VAEETLPAFVPDSPPAPYVSSGAASNGRYEQADSVAGAMTEAQTDAKMYSGAYARGWRVFAKGDDGHFWYRIGAYRFVNRKDALIFDRSPEVVASGAPALAPADGSSGAEARGTEVDKKIADREKVAEQLGIAGERRASSRRDRNDRETAATRRTQSRC